MDEPLSHSPEKEQGRLLTIDGDPDVVEPFMFGEGMYLSEFYFLCYDMDTSTYVSEKQFSEDIYKDLNEEEDIRMDNSREEHWRDVFEEVHDNKNIHTLRW